MKITIETVTQVPVVNIEAQLPMRIGVDGKDADIAAAEAATSAANSAATLAGQRAGEAEVAAQGAREATENTITATEEANTATANANNATEAATETAEHPTYIGLDHYVYKWNRLTKSYDKTDIYCKGDAFSISKVYPSIAAMEADYAGTDTKVGDFVLIETGDNEDPDNSKLYVKTSTEWAYLTDLSGAIGFTGKTPQLSIGTVTTGAPGSAVTVTISEDGIDDSGNPKFKLNFAIPQGDPGKVMQFSVGDVETGDPGSNAEVTITADGVDEQGNPKKKINFAIPRGDTGKSAYQDYFDNTEDDPVLTEAEWSVWSKEQGDFAKEQGNFAKEQGELAQTAREGIEEDLASKIDKSSITSELGDSEELVMSQKGVEEKIKLPVESGEQAAAAALVELKKEVAYLKKVLSNVITYLQINTLSVDSLQIKGAPLFIFSDVVPAVVPDFAGQIYIKTTATAAAWIALGDTSVANWKEI